MKTFRLLSLLFLMVFLCTEVWAQDLVFQTFKDRRVINVQSVETLPKRKLDVRIAHRFGDVAGTMVVSKRFLGWKMPGMSCWGQNTESAII
jgi:hypothetical protein